MKRILLLPAAFLLMIFSSFDILSDCNSDGQTYYSIDEALADVAGAKKLDIAMNKLSSIDAKIGGLVNLECLDLSFNTFSTLPSELKNLQKLSYLNLSGTRYMAKVPDVVFELKALKVLDLSDHPEWKQDYKASVVKLLPNVKVILSSEDSGPVKLD